MIRVLMVGAAAAALLTGCSSSSDTVQAAPLAAAAVAPVDATAKKACEVAPEDLLVAIAEKGVTQLSLLEGFAVQSAGAGDVYLVAAKVVAAGRDEEVAVFATDGLDAATGTVLAVDAAARALTSWAPSTDAALGADTPAAALARACVAG